MNLFHAAIYTNKFAPGRKEYDSLTPAEVEARQSVRHILESYHYVNKPQYVDLMRANGAKVFLDSGAFSAHTLGATIDLPGYCRYIQENEDIIRKDGTSLMASVLDGIGDAQLTYENQMAMERLGVRPLPCFHSGEDPRYLDWYVANYEYITLGGMVGAGTDKLIVWLDRIWENHLTDGAGRAKCKVHGFGITAIPIMERYPWHSVDSSSWLQSANFGSIVHPDYGPISVSEKSPSRHAAGQHICNMKEIDRQTVIASVEAQGFTIERLAKEYPSRWAYNCWSYGQINDIINARKTVQFQAPVMELF